MIRHTEEDTSSREMPRRCYVIFNRYNGFFELD